MEAGDQGTERYEEGIEVVMEIKVETQSLPCLSL